MLFCLKEIRNQNIPVKNSERPSESPENEVHLRATHLDAASLDTNDAVN